MAIKTFSFLSNFSWLHFMQCWHSSLSVFIINQAVSKFFDFEFFFHSTDFAVIFWFFNIFGAFSKSLLIIQFFIEFFNIFVGMFFNIKFSKVNRKPLITLTFEMAGFFAMKTCFFPLCKILLGFFLKHFVFEPLFY